MAKSGRDNSKDGAVRDDLRAKVRLRLLRRMEEYMRQLESHKGSPRWREVGEPLWRAVMKSKALGSRLDEFLEGEGVKAGAWVLPSYEQAAVARAAGITTAPGCTCPGAVSSSSKPLVAVPLTSAARAGATGAEAPFTAHSEFEVDCHWHPNVTAG